MAVVPADAPVRVEPTDEGALWRVVLGGSKGNILDGKAMAALKRVFEAAQRETGLRAVILEGEGKHFSFGASVQEHLPGQVAEMLASFREMLLALFDSHVTHLAAVRGQCLGGGLELVTCCHRIFASPGAKLGQPEIQLGVFAPVASLLLPERIGRGPAEDLCLTGRVVGAEEAARLGLVDVLAEEPGEAAMAWAREHLLRHSAASLRFAVRAARSGLRQRLATGLEELERLYLDELMKTQDALEGLESFLEKRPPAWKNA
jgi:cyclohexa-1,5-dienecarbonyl-CoA hydratase